MLYCCISVFCLTTTPVQAPDLANIMGALGQGPSVARGNDFVKTKLKTRKEVAKRKQNDQKSTDADSAPGPSNTPGPSGAPACSGPSASSPGPLRILKLSPAQFAEVKRAKLEREANTKAEVASVSVKSVLKVEGPPQSSNPVMPKFLPPFPFSQFMPLPNQPTISNSMAPVNNVMVSPTNSEHVNGTTMMWQAYAMSSFQK